ncbi:MAG: hypothetical protein HQ562_07860 [Candidatus Marinimicrobia bacterium]|nr:hypothetical protein [Candidatus Neomarinimicrobiota bacterium]
MEKAEEMSKIAVAKTEELTRISKIKIEIRQLQRDLDKNFEELGRYVRKSADEKNLNFTGDDEVLVLLGKLSETENVIAEKNKQIQNIKEEYHLKESEINADTSAAKEDKAATEEAPPDEKPKSKPKSKKTVKK